MPIIAKHFALVANSLIELCIFHFVLELHWEEEGHAPHTRRTFLLKNPRLRITWAQEPKGFPVWANPPNLRFRTHTFPTLKTPAPPPGSNVGGGMKWLGSYKVCQIERRYATSQSNLNWLQRGAPIQLPFATKLIFF